MKRSSSVPLWCVYISSGSWKERSRYSRASSSFWSAPCQPSRNKLRSNPRSAPRERTFGHKKRVSGAISDRNGRFQIAHEGTLSWWNRRYARIASKIAQGARRESDCPTWRVNRYQSIRGGRNDQDSSGMVARGESERFVPQIECYTYKDTADSGRRPDIPEFCSTLPLNIQRNTRRILLESMFYCNMIGLARQRNSHLVKDQRMPSKTIDLYDLPGEFCPMA